MSQMDVAVESYNQALNSSGETMKQNAVYMDSLEAHTTALKAEFEKLVLSGGGLQDAAKKFIDLGTAILKFANSDIGQVIIQTTLLVTALGLLNKGFTLISTKIIDAGAALITYALAVNGATIDEIAMTVASMGLAGALKAVAAAMLDATIAFLTSPFGIILVGLTACTAAAIASTKAFEKYQRRLQDANETLNETAENVENLESELNGLKSSLKDISDQIEENNKRKLELTNDNQVELLDLENQKLADKTKALEIQIALKEKELELAKKTAEEEAKTVLSTTTASQFKKTEIVDSFSGAGTGEYVGVEVLPEEELQLAIDKYKELKEKASDLQAQLDKTDPNTKEWEELNSQLDSTNAEMTTVSERGAEMSDIVVNAMSNIGSMADDERKKLNNLVIEFLQLDDASEAFRRGLKLRLDELGEGGQVNLNLRPVIDAEELTKAGYDAAEGIATVFTHTFSNEAEDIAINFTPIMVDPNTGEYLGVMEKGAFEQYCQDVVDGVRQDDLNLQIGAKFEGEDAVEKAEEAAEEIHEIHETLSSDSQQYQEELDEEVEEIDEAEAALQKLANTHNVAIDDLKEWAKELGISEEALVSYADALGVSVEKAYEFKQQLNSWDEQIDSLQSSVATLSTAMDEYNESQEFSIDTVQALLQLQPQYLSMLVEENGELKLNEQAITDKANALIEERKQTALQMAYERLAAIERSYNQAAAESESGAVYGNADALRDETNVLSENTVQQYANRIARNDKAKGTAASQVVRELQAELKVLDKIGSSYGSVSKGARSAGRAGSSGARSATNAQKELNKELEETKSKYEKVISWIKKQYDKKTDSLEKAKDAATDAIEKEIKALEKEKDTILDGIEKETDALEKEKDAREKYWDDQIDALKKANQEKKDALELQEKLDALEKARNTKVKIYKEGQGFVYDVDQTAVAEAQKALDEYLSEKAYEDELARLEALKDAEMDNYDKRIDALNDYKDKVSASYEEQISALEDHKAALEEQYDAEIEMYNNYKQQFEDMVNAYQEEQDRLLAQQLLGINLESDNWMTRLDNLAEFVNKYNALQKQLDTGNTSTSNDASMKTGGGDGGSFDGGLSSSTKRTVSNYSKPKDSRDYTPDYATRTTPQQREYQARVKHLGKTYASGASSIKDDEIAVVGENPNKEIVIGSKLNNGELMSLNKGSGVVNAESSSTLAGMLNQVGKFGASGFGSGNGTLNSNINNDTLTINGVTIQGSDIKDPQTFVNGLLNLKAEALQRAYKHR